MLKIKISPSIGKLRLKNPVLVASGTFGYGLEYKDLLNLDQLGAIVTKTLTLKPAAGNPQPRIFEVPSGMINTIGLQNVGVERFLKEKLPELKKITTTPIIASIAGKRIAEFVHLAEILSGKVSAIELNLSCPNVREGLISQKPDLTYSVVKQIKRKIRIPLIVKLSPQVTDIVGVARSAEKAGADAISLINSLPALFFPKISDWQKLRKFPEPVFGGLSGPCIKPVALKMVYQVARSIKIPVIGMGGIMNLKDALEFFSAGATAIAVGCANFVDPQTPIKIINGLKKLTGLWN